MPPIYIKGGVWTNVEDEILKAAVQKYGINQWSRVASLLTKKSAKQAKARWNEWINPTLNKTKWSREEDEKLLNLVKLLPNQWRSIAPIMGRTATHCVERYQQLLDDENDKGDEQDELEEIKFSGPGIESMPATGPVTGSGADGNTHIGDLNINPESIPAKPDDDELEDADREMLFEARARLANTKGKKAKRREREKMLEETKRISLLQKRRELKAAGLDTSLVSKNKKKSKEFDYNADIPFEHQPPPGIYDTADEDKQGELLKKKFETQVRHKGLDQPGQKEKRKHQKPQQTEIKGDAELREPPVKRTKLELPPVESLSKPNQFATELTGVFDKLQEEKSPDIDERIAQATKDIKANQAKKSSLLRTTDDYSDSVSAVIRELDPKQRMKSIRKLVMKEFGKLPQPKMQYKIPSIVETTNEDPHSESMAPASDSLSKYNVSNYYSSQRESLVVKKGLDIPNPRLLKDYSQMNLSKVEQAVAEQFAILIESDYKMHVDRTYNYTPDIWVMEESVSREIKDKIDQELKNKAAQGEVHKYELPYNSEVIQGVFSHIQQLKSQSMRLQEVLLTRGGFEDTTAMFNEINDLNEMYNKQVIDYNVFKDIYHKEEGIMNARLARLQKLVDSIVSVEQQLTTSLRERRHNKI